MTEPSLTSLRLDAGPAGSAFEATDPFTPQARHIAVVSGGIGEPSQTRMLADALADAATAGLSGHGIVPEVHTLPLRELSVDIGQGMVTTAKSEPLLAALRQVEQADAVIAVSPTFKASYSGLFKAFFDLLEEESLAGVPVLLGATGGTARHSLMIDQAMRPLFAYLKTWIVPTAVFAASDDWGAAGGRPDSTRTTPLDARIRAAGAELADILSRLPARPRAAAEGQTADLEVIPFDRLLNPDA
ncbi:oxidoreductase [Micrococcus flavus]|uniref:FMN reductase n=1 Tax=Micrococcus flavus TaxID=384602 RepID=A0A4Y8X4C7_9MICC|nr:CE1759 family FMN reductase [Micrococcus flavus]MBB4883102.1 FMN reductase [Micrococcus flavus]TFI04513.1 oxidoreductase [Micrococcus flavus]GGK42407.1 FMN reductase [Micrococcus flavus]